MSLACRRLPNRYIVETKDTASEGLRITSDTKVDRMINPRYRQLRRDMMIGATREETLTMIRALRASAIIRTKDMQLASDAMDAAIQGGFRLVEFTLTTPGALDLITKFAKRRDLLVGAGTVMDPSAAREAVSAGARFLVSPIADEAVIHEASALGVPVIPGAATPTEMQRAYRLGADLIKVFPAPAGGVSFIQAILGPMPHLRLFPTAGVDEDNFAEFLNAGCVGVGFVRSLFDPRDLQRRDLHAITRRAARIMDRLAALPSL